MHARSPFFPRTLRIAVVASGTGLGIYFASQLMHAAHVTFWPGLAWSVLLGGASGLLAATLAVAISGRR